MRNKNLDLIITVLIVVLNVGWVQIPNRPGIVSIILALPLVLFLPGYALIQGLAWKKSSPQEPSPARNTQSRHPIGGADKLILSLGLSMAIDILMGFLLNILPIGLTALSWTIALGLFTTLCSLLALFMRRRNAVEPAKAPRIHMTLIDGLFLIVATFIIINAVWLAVIRPPVPQPSFTQFWMLPANATHKTCAVSLGVQSFEQSPLTYTVIVTVNNQQIAQNWSPITLAPQQKWSQVVSVTPEAQNDLVVAAQLYRTDQPHTVYRSVHLTFHVSVGLQNGQLQQECTLGT